MTWKFNRTGLCPPDDVGVILYNKHGGLVSRFFADRGTLPEHWLMPMVKPVSLTEPKIDEPSFDNRTFVYIGTEGDCAIYREA